MEFPSRAGLEEGAPEGAWKQLGVSCLALAKVP